MITERLYPDSWLEYFPLCGLFLKWTLTFVVTSLILSENLLAQRQLEIIRRLFPLSLQHYLVGPCSWTLCTVRSHWSVFGQTGFFSWFINLEAKNSKDIVTSKWLRYHINGLLLHYCSSFFLSRQTEESREKCWSNRFNTDGYIILLSCPICSSTWFQWGCGCKGLVKKSWSQINWAIYGPTVFNCCPRDGKYCSLSKITGCLDAPKARFMSDHKCSQRAAVRVGLISALVESRSVTHAPLGNNVMDASGMQGETLQRRRGHFALHHFSPRRSLSDTRWRASIPCRTMGGCQAVTELQPLFAADLCHSTGKQMERRPCHMLPCTKIPLDTLDAPKTSVFSKDRPNQHPTVPMGRQLLLCPMTMLQLFVPELHAIMFFCHGL